MLGLVGCGATSPEPRSADYVHKLGPADVIETDEADRIVAVRSPTGTVRFVPGTATSPTDSDEVRGERADAPKVTEPLPVTPAHGESTRATGLLVGGAIVFAMAYGPMAYVASQSTGSWDKSLFIPVAGPWLDLANRPTCVAPAVPVALPIDPCIGETRIALVVGGVLQAGGVLMTLFGIPAHDVASGDHGVHVSVVPSGLGGAVIGSF
jgi:hypothetical protein